MTNNWLPTVPRVDACGQCAKNHTRWQLGQREGDPKYLDRPEPRIHPCEADKGGARLGLCARHGQYERYLREELARHAADGALTPERARECRRVAWARTRPQGRDVSEAAE